MTDPYLEVSAADGQEWVAGLSAELEGQRALLTRLLRVCATVPVVSSLSVGCSLGRGAGDALSDVDAALGVRAPRGEPGAAEILVVEEAVLAGCVSDHDPVGVLRDRVGPPDRLVRRVLAQLADGVQLDLAIMAEPEVRRGDAAPDFIPLYRDASVRAARPRTEREAPPAPSAYVASADQVHGWAFLGWVALIDLAKYLDRGSLWEAHQRLHEVRGRIWSLWAAAQGATYPRHGLSQVLDHDPDLLPPGIETTVAGLDHADLHRAAVASGAVLREVGAAAAGRVGATLPEGMDAYTSRRLSLAGRGRAR